MHLSCGAGIQPALNARNMVVVRASSLHQNLFPLKYFDIAIGLGIESILFFAPFALCAFARGS